MCHFHRGRRSCQSELPLEKFDVRNSDDVALLICVTSYSAALLAKTTHNDSWSQSTRSSLIEVVE